MDLITTPIGKIATAFRPGNPTVIFLSGTGTLSTADNYRPLITSLPPNVGYLTIDNINSGLSQIATSPWTLNDVVVSIKQAIQHYQVEDFVIVAHSFAGVYTMNLLADPNLPVKAFFGIEPTTYEIMTNPSHDVPYRKLLARDREMTQDQARSLLEKYSEQAFSSQEKKHLFQVADGMANKLQAIVESGKSELVQGSTDLDEFWTETPPIPNEIPAIIFTEPYRADEYLRSEYMNDNPLSRVYGIGDNHYLQWTEKAFIAERLNEFLQQLSE